MKEGDHSPELSIVQERMLNAATERFVGSKPVPAYMLDSVRRMDTQSVLRHTGIKEDLPQELVELEPEQAWTYIGGDRQVAVPYDYPINIRGDLKYAPRSTGEQKLDSVGFAMMVATRSKIIDGYYQSGRLISDELLNLNNLDSLQVSSVIRSWLDYDKQICIESDAEEAAVITDSELLVPVQSNYPPPEIVVAIPVRLGEDTVNMRATLQALSDQDIDPKKVEIVVLGNKILSVEEASLEANSKEFIECQQQIECQVSQFEEEIFDFLLENPSFRIRALGAVLGSWNSIGSVRRTLFRDIANTHLRRSAENNPIIVNLDADTTSLSSSFLEGILETKEHSTAPVVVPRLRWATDLAEGKIPRNSAVGRLLRLDRFMPEVSSSHHDRVGICDDGMAVNLKEYCLVGGHIGGDGFLENGNIGLCIRDYFEADDKPAIAVSKKSILGSHPRRQLDTMSRGYSPAKAWDREITSFGKDNDRVRTQQVPFEQAEKRATAELEEWTREVVEAYAGGRNDEVFKAKEEVIRKGLQIIGLPDIFSA